MTINSSYIGIAALVAGLTGGSLSLDTGNTTCKIALFDGTQAQTDPSTAQHYGSAPWNAGECTGTNWAAGGVAVSFTGKGLTAKSGGVMNLDLVPVSVANTTISTAYKCAIIYDTAQSNAVVCCIYFGGDSYTTTGTPAGFTPPAAGAFNLAGIPNQ